MGSDRRLVYLLQRAARASLNYGNAVLAEQLDVSLTQLATLSLLAKQPSSTMTDVAEAMDLNKSAASSMLNRLERAGLIRREPNPEDGRGTVLSLTSQGEHTRVAAVPSFRRLTATLVSGFSADEIEVVLRFLNAVVARCGDAQSPPA